MIYTQVAKKTKRVIIFELENILGSNSIRNISLLLESLNIIFHFQQQNLHLIINMSLIKYEIMFANFNMKLNSIK